MKKLTRDQRLKICKERLSKRREELNKMTLEKLSKISGIPINVLKSYSCGRRLPEGNNLFDLAESLQVNPAWLIGESDDMNLIDALSKDSLYSKYYSLFNREDMRFFSELAAYDDEIEEEVGYMISHTDTDITVTKHFSAEEMQGFYEKTYAAIVDLFKYYKESD